MTDDNANDLLMLTADIVSAQVAANKIAPSDLAGLIISVHSALAGLGQEVEAQEPEQVKRPIGVRASIKEHGLVSMIDGKVYQCLRRHLSRHDLTPETYRQKFGLPADYPMVSPGYSEKRRMLAKAIGLGTKAGRTSAPTPSKTGARRTLKVALDAAKGHLGSEYAVPDDYDLERFVAAQEGVYDAALSELRRGAKRTHWMWFIFPQIAGLGTSEMARRYAIGSLDEARSYLAHPLLGLRLREAVAVLQDLIGTNAVEVFGPVDAVKLRSSLTLFVEAGGGPLLQAALNRWCGGAPDEETVRRLR